MELLAFSLWQVELPREDEEAEAMETDNPAADTASAVAALNFDSLSRQEKARMDKEAREQLDTEFAARIEEQQAALAKVLPNLKAVEQYEEAKVCHLSSFLVYLYLCRPAIYKTCKSGMWVQSSVCIQVWD